MSLKVDIDPLTRIEGHLAVKVEIENNAVSAAYCSGEMFRGFEVILRGRDPLDAQQITQRICGVCPISHGMASILAQEQAYGLTPPENGRVARNLILGANYIQSHLVHFYQLSALDFVDITAILAYRGKDRAMCALRDWAQGQINSGVMFPAAPFLPRYKGDYISDQAVNLGAIAHYVEALDMRAEAQKALALFGGKAPHATALIPGGVTVTITDKRIAAYAAIMARLRWFIDNVYIPDVLAVAGAYPQYFAQGKGCGNFLAYGVFPLADGAELLPGGRVTGGRLEQVDVARISEDVGHSYFSSASGLNPAGGATDPQPEKPGAYSWLKAPRYDGRPYEVGPSARMMAAYLAGHAQAKAQMDSLMSATGIDLAGLDSVMGRHALRALECKIVADACAEWIEQLTPGAKAFTDFDLPQKAAGVGLTEAPRGALGHWITIEGRKIANYQCVVPTTWNCSPRDDKGVPGPMEQALVGTAIADAENPIEAARVVRSFDPCLACAVH